MAEDHGFEVEGAAGAEVVFGVDDRFVFRSDSFFLVSVGRVAVGVSGAGRWGADGGQVHAAGGKGVLQHHQHGGVFLARLRRVVGVVVGDVKVEFDLAQVLVGREAGGEDLVALLAVCRRAGPLVAERVGPFFKVGAWDYLREGEVGDGAGDGCSRAGA